MGSRMSRQQAGGTEGAAAPLSGVLAILEGKKGLKHLRFACGTENSNAASRGGKSRCW